MRRIRVIGMSLLLILLPGMQASCDKDDISTTGLLKVSFYNHPGDIQVIIKPAENTQIIIYSLRPGKDGKAEKVLNIGNYYAKVITETYFSPAGFQIISDNTTSLSRGSLNDSSAD